MKALHIFAVLTLAIWHASAQTFVPVTNTTITVNSVGSLTGNPRNYVRVNLPPKTTGYVYRASISPKGEKSSADDLFSALKTLSPTNISMGVELTELIIKNGDGSALDAFTFNNVYDADNFSQRMNTNWSACHKDLNMVNTCYTSSECLSPTLFFGFKNNNMMQGLNVHFELVAIVDTLKKSQSYSYSLMNAANQELKFQVSNDGNTWETVMLRNGYTKTFTIDQSILHFKIYTSTLNFVSYDLLPGERYKIGWSTKNRWDIFRY